MDLVHGNDYGDSESESVEREPVERGKGSREEGGYGKREESRSRSDSIG